MWTLILILIINSRVSIHSVDFATQYDCETAKQAVTKAIANNKNHLAANPHPIFVCVNGASEEAEK